MGALDWYKIVHGHQGWRLISCIWLHAGVIHLLANMLSLVFIGIRLEQQFGFGMSSSLISYFSSVNTSPALVIIILNLNWRIQEKEFFCCIL